jgi:hypothetical protein
LLCGLAVGLAGIRVREARDRLRISGRVEDDDRGVRVPVGTTVAVGLTVAVGVTRDRAAGRGLGRDATVGRTVNAGRA